MGPSEKAAPLALPPLARRQKAETREAEKALAGEEKEEDEEDESKVLA